MTIKIQMKNVSKIFGPRPKKIIPLIEEGQSKEQILKETKHTVGVYDASLDIYDGEFFVIMGLSGSGKSTLIRCFNLLNVPTHGEIIVDGEDIVKYSKAELRQFRQKKIAMVFQHFGLFSHRTILENVEYGLEIRHLAKDERRKIAMEQLENVGLLGYEEQYPDQLSGGMQQRVGIARALTNDPDILLMDEPFSALDPLIRREMQLELIDLQERLQKTIIFITHDVNEAFKLGDCVAVMKDGKVVQIGTPEEILEEPNDEYIASFTQDIDRTKVLQAEHIMTKPHNVLTLKDGLQMGVKIMRTNGISSVFVTDRHRKVLGMITIDDALEAIQQKIPIEQIIRPTIQKVQKDTYIQDLLPLVSESSIPIVVVDENERMVGLIFRVHVLTSLISETDELEV